MKKVLVLSILYPSTSESPSFSPSGSQSPSGSRSPSSSSSSSMSPSAPLPSTYYVKSSGDDGNDGLSELTAWKTLSKVNSASFREGDSILFNCGDTFAGTLTQDSPGTSAEYIYYGKFGTGDDPIIDGSGATRSLDLTSGNAAYVEYHDIVFSGANGAGIATAQCYGHHLTFEDCQFLNSGGHNGLSISGDGVGQSSYCIVRRCYAAGNYRNGFYISGDGATCGNNLIEYCLAENNGTSDSADHGMYIDYDVTARYNVCRNNKAAGIKTNDEFHPTTTQFPKIYGNELYGNNLGVYLGHKNCIVHDNLIYGNTYANLTLDPAADGCKIYFNTFVNSTHATARTASINGTICLNNDIRNNIFIQDMSVVTRGIWETYYTSSIEDIITGGNTIDYNIYYTLGSASAITFAYSAGDAIEQRKSWNNWIATGLDAHSTFLTSLPEVNTRYTDLTPFLGNLTSLGIFIDGYDIDINGDSRPAHPTPGCYVSSGVLPILVAEANLPDKNILKVTFNHDIYSSDYSLGIAIKEDGIEKTITDSSRQVDHSQVYYTVDGDFVTGSELTIEYSSAVGEYMDDYDEIKVENISSFVATNNIVEILLDKDFDDGTTQGATVTDVDGHLTVVGSAALNGSSNGISLYFNDNNSLYLSWILPTPSLTGITNARVFFDPNSCSMGANNSFYLLSFVNDLNQDCGGIEINYNSGFAVRAYIYDDGGTFYESVRTYITDAPHRIEVKLSRSSSLISDDGQIDMLVDGANLKSITVLNYSRFDKLNKIVLGASGIDTATRGTVFVDELVVNNTGDEIGA